MDTINENSTNNVLGSNTLENYEFKRFYLSRPLDFDAYYCYADELEKQAETIVYLYFVLVAICIFVIQKAFRSQRFLQCEEVAGAFVLLFCITAEILYYLYLRTDNGYLVCVEKNPGPGDPTKKINNLLFEQTRKFEKKNKTKNKKRDIQYSEVNFDTSFHLKRFAKFNECWCVRQHVLFVAMQRQSCTGIKCFADRMFVDAEYCAYSVERLGRGATYVGALAWASEYRKHCCDIGNIPFDSHLDCCSAASFSDLEPQVFGFPSMNIGVDPAVQAVMSDLAAAVSVLGDNVKDIKVDHTSNILSDTIGRLTSDLPSKKSLMCLSLICLCAVAYFAKSKVARTIAQILAVYMSVSLVCPYVQELISSVTEIFFSDTSSSTETLFENSEFGDNHDDEAPIVAQVDGGYVPFIMPLLSGVYYWTHGSDGKDIIKVFLQGCRDLPRMSEGLESLVAKVVRICKDFVNHCLNLCGREHYFSDSDLFPEVQEMQNKLNTLVNALRTGAAYNYENAMIAFQIERDVLSILAKIPSSKEFADTRTRVAALLGQVRPLVSKFERNNILNNGPRKEPYAFMIAGPTGVGKSTVAMPIVLAVMARVLPASRLESFANNHNDEIWNFVAENVFHDSYHGQFCTFIDEAGQKKDAVGSSDEAALAVFRMANMAAFPLHMAHLEDKGCTNFTSRLMVATTNRNFFKWESIYDNEAYTRRWRTGLVLVPKKEFCSPGTYDGDSSEGLWKRRLDMSKLVLTDDGIETHMYEFYEWDFLNGRRLTRVWTFETLVEELVRQYHQLDEVSEKVLQFHSTVKNRYLAMRRTATPDVIHPQCDSGELGTWEKFASSVTGVFGNPNVKRALAALAATLAIAVPIWQFVLSPALVGQSDPRVSKAKPLRRFWSRSSIKPRVRRTVSSVGGASQSNIGKNTFDVANKILRGNLYSIGLGDNDHVGFALFIKGRLCCIPSHYVDKFDADEERQGEPLILRFRRMGSPDVGFDVPYADMDMFDCTDEDDTVFINMPKVVHEHSDLTGFFINSEDLKKFSHKFAGCLLLPRDGGHIFATSDIIRAGAVSYGDEVLSEAFTYPIATRVGDCGSPVFVTERSLGKVVILGVHVAGNGSYGFCNFLSSDLLSKAVREADCQITYKFDPTGPVFEQMGGKFLVGKRLKDVPIPSKSKIIKTPLYEAWKEASCAPAMLFKRGTLDPWSLARDKYSTSTPAMNSVLLSSCAFRLASSMRFNSLKEAPWHPRIFSFEEAVEGIPGVEHWDGIPRKTSPGYPFNTMRAGKGKRPWFGDDGEYDFSSDLAISLSSEIKEAIGRLSKGERCEFYYVDYLKDERLPKAKVAKGKARLISASPMHYFILCRMYYGDFVRWVMDNNVNNSIAMGVNPYSSDWQRIVDHLQARGDNMIFGDYSAFDGSLSQGLMYAGYRVIENFYYNATHEERLVRATLFEDIVNSVHVRVTPDCTHAYEWYGSNPSGNFLTTTLNSICNLLAVYYAAAAVKMQDLGFPWYTRDYGLVDRCLTHAFSNVGAIVFGDDNGLSVSDEAKGVYKPFLLAKELGRIGLKYTDENKVPLGEGFRPLTECSFLKRGFRFESSVGLHVAPLSIDVILEMPFWSKSDAPKGSLQDTLDTAVRELSLHGRDVFDANISVIKPHTLSCVGHLVDDDYNRNLNLALSQEVEWS